MSEGHRHKALKAAGVDFAIIRAGISESVDKVLDANVQGCISAGIKYGFYWFSYAKTNEQARREAAACIKAISKYPAPEYPVFFDAENNGVAKALGREAMTDVALTFVDVIEDGGYPSGVYANPNWMECEYNKVRLIKSTDI